MQAQVRPVNRDLVILVWRSHTRCMAATPGGLAACAASAAWLSRTVCDPFFLVCSWTFFPLLFKEITWKPMLNFFGSNFKFRNKIILLLRCEYFWKQKNNACAISQDWQISPVDSKPYAIEHIRSEYMFWNNPHYGENTQNVIWKKWVTQQLNNTVLYSGMFYSLGT